MLGSIIPFVFGQGDAWEEHPTSSRNLWHASDDSVGWLAWLEHRPAVPGGGVTDTAVQVSRVQAWVASSHWVPCRSWAAVTFESACTLALRLRPGRDTGSRGFAAAAGQSRWFWLWPQAREAFDSPAPARRGNSKLIWACHESRVLTVDSESLTLIYSQCDWLLATSQHWKPWQMMNLRVPIPLRGRDDRKQ